MSVKLLTNGAVYIKTLGSIIIIDGEALDIYTYPCLSRDYRDRNLLASSQPLTAYHLTTAARAIEREYENSRWSDYLTGELLPAAQRALQDYIEEAHDGN